MIAFIKKSSFYLFLLMSVESCSKQTEFSSQFKARELTTEEKLLDLDVAFNHFKNYYAPLQYKEKTLGVSYEQIFAQLRKEAELTKTDQEYFDVLGKLVDSFKDGHVSVSIPRAQKVSLPIYLDYFDEHYVVVDIDPEFSAATSINVGDEILSMDGVPASILAAKMLEYDGLGYDRADKRLGAFMLTHRKNALPESNRTHLEVKRGVDGAVFNVSTFWKRDTGIAAKANGVQFRSENSQVGIDLFGAEKPFFYNAITKQNFSFVRVLISEQQWLAAGETGKPYDIFALLYRHNGKTVLLVRIPSYGVTSAEASRNIKTYQMLLSTYSSLADVLVIDQTHNPGGSVSYVEELSRLFFKQPGPSFAFKPRADRLWLKDINDIISTPGISSAEKTYFSNVYNQIDQANDKGDFLGPQMSLTRLTSTLSENTAWNKPVLLLIDELCGSGGDGLPMILKGNKVATLFGNRTSGMGGNVSSVPALPNSGAEFKLTRSLFYLATADGSMPDSAIIENNGVTPDIERAYGYSDFKESFTTYVKDFSDAAVALIK